MKVSVIIPVYKTSDCIERCIRSVMEQRYPQIECVIVDDASPDDSIFKCERLIENYEGSIQFNILHHGINQGLSAARNTGIRAAKGEWLFFMDSDDEITNDCIKKLMSISEKHPDTEMVWGNIVEIWTNGKRHDRFIEGFPSELKTHGEVLKYYNQLLIPNFAWNKLMKRSFVEEHCLYFKEGIVYEDFLWMFYVTKYLSVVYYLNEGTYYYYRRQDSITLGANAYTTGKSNFVIYNEILHHLTPGQEVMELNRYLRRFCEHYLQYMAVIPQYESLLKEYQKSSLEHGSYSAYRKLGVTKVLGKLPYILRVKHLMRAFQTKVKFV